MYTIAANGIPRLYSGPHDVSQFTLGESYCDGSVILYYKNTTGWITPNVGVTSSAIEVARTGGVAYNLFSGIETASIEFYTHRDISAVYAASNDTSSPQYVGQATGRIPVVISGEATYFDLSLGVRARIGTGRSPNGQSFRANEEKYIDNPSGSGSVASGLTSRTFGVINFIQRPSEVEGGPLVLLEQQFCV